MLSSTSPRIHNASHSDLIRPPPSSLLLSSSLILLVAHLLSRSRLFISRCIYARSLSSDFSHLEKKKRRRLMSYPFVFVGGRGCRRVHLHGVIVLSVPHPPAAATAII
jgi:hypothetical protein